MQTIKNIVNTVLSHPALLLLIRLLVGGVFLVFGVAKALAPIEEFIASINSYQMLPEFIVPLFANVMIYTEIVIGLLFVLGLFTKRMAQAHVVLLGMFIIAIGQAMVRGLELLDCGCGGGLKLGETPGEVLGRDIIMLILVGIFLLQQTPIEKRWSLDRLMGNSGSQE